MVAEVGMGVISPDHYKFKKSPWILDESNPRPKAPLQVMSERAHQRALERAKNKPDSERNFVDYFILAQDKLEKMKDSTVIYMA